MRKHNWIDDGAFVFIQCENCGLIAMHDEKDDEFLPQCIEQKYVRFMEPHPYIEGAHCLVEMPVEAAIAYQKKIRPYPSDEEALDDFVVINWASIHEHSIRRGDR